MSKLIAVWGSPSSGKTVTSAKLAYQLALDTKKTVILVSGDDLTPLVPVLFPGNNEKLSVGKILESPDIYNDLILQNMVSVSDNLAVLAYAHGDNELSYTRNTLERSNDLLLHLSHMADYVIADCSSDFRRNKLTDAALLQAEVVLQLYSGEPRSELFFAAQRASLDNERYHYQSFTRILRLGRNSKMQAVNEMKSAMERVGGIIPYSLSTAQQYEAGKLFTQSPDAKFNKAIEKITKGCE